MIVAAFDMGVRNFAFAVVNVSEDDPWGKVLAIGACDLRGDNPYLNLIDYLKQHDALWQKVSVVLIEQQLLRSNVMASKLSCHTHAYFLHRHPNVPVFDYPSTYKTRMTGMTGPSSHRQRKQHAIQLVIDHLTETDPVALDWLSCFGKKDDICDCVLMCATFTQSPIFLRLH